MIELQPTQLATGFSWPEAPRWRDGKLWISDMFGANSIKTLTPDGKVETVVRHPSTGGLGWTKDGSMLFVSCSDNTIMKRTAKDVSVYADLRPFLKHQANDMVLDGQDRAYLGNFGFDLLGGEKPKPTHLLLVEPSGEVRVVADGLTFPNGMVITPDGKTLLVNESYANCVTAFEIARDGSLSKRRVFAQLAPEIVPDGLTLDEDGAVWLASWPTGQCLRVKEGGEVTHEIKFKDTFAPSCMLGGPDRKTLYVLTCHNALPKAIAGEGDGRAWTVRVDHAGVGLP